jgi:hypothetical protein
MMEKTERKVVIIFIRPTSSGKRIPLQKAAKRKPPVESKHWPTANGKSLLQKFRIKGI